LMSARTELRAAWAAELLVEGADLTREAPRTEVRFLMDWRFWRTVGLRPSLVNWVFLFWRAVMDVLVLGSRVALM